MTITGGFPVPEPTFALELHRSLNHQRRWMPPLVNIRNSYRSAELRCVQTKESFAMCPMTYRPYVRVSLTHPGNPRFTLRVDCLSNREEHNMRLIPRAHL